MSTRSAMLCLLASSLLAASPPGRAADSIPGLLDNPDGALEFDYCAWRFAEGGTDDGLPEFKSVLDNLDGSSSESELRAAALADAGINIALTAPGEKACRKTFDSGNKMHEKALTKTLRRFRSRPNLSDDPQVASIQSKIHDLWRDDQAARQVYIGNRTDDTTGSRFWARRLAYSLATDVDAQSTAYVRTTLDQYDWIDAHRFGKTTANRAWLLVQHADDHPEFQQLVLGRMEKYLADGGVEKRDYAYLWDRVAVNHDRKQRYGTQPDWDCKDGQLELMPLEDPDDVDARRAEMGLGPVQAALTQMSQSVCGGD